MKLLIITAIKAFQKDIKSILKNARVMTYSYSNVTGYKDISDQLVESNWFASELNETESILFYAFADNEMVTQVFDLISVFNQQQEALSQIHIAVVDIEKSNHSNSK